MKRFRFPLERIRQWRAAEAQIEESRLAALNAERRAIESRREQVESGRRSAGPAGDLTGADLAALDAYRTWARRESERLRIEAGECDRRIAGQREAVLEARRRSRLLDRLRDQALASWNAGLDREVESAAAEAYLAQWKRKSG